MTIYVTGDIHGARGITRLSKNDFINNKSFIDDDVLIICGDFGLVFEKEESKDERY